MEDHAVFSLSTPPDEGDLEVIENLNELLMKVGGKIHITEKDFRGETLWYLHIHFNSEEAKKCIARGAGRQHKQTKGLYTIGEVKQLLKERSASSVATQLGISRATLFRRLKKAEDEFEGADWLYF